MTRRPAQDSKPSARKKTSAHKAAPAVIAPAPLDPAKLKQLYTCMLGCRLMSARAQSLIEQRRLVGDGSSMTGHEAIAVGSLINLTAEDCVAPGRCDLMARFIQGTPLRHIFAGLCGRQAAQGRRGTHSRNGHVDAIVPSSPAASQLNMATGAAWAFKLQKRPQVVVSLYGDDLGRDCWREAVGLSVVYQLPIVHLIHGSNKAAHEIDLGEGTQRYMLPCFTVDGDDVVAIYRVAQEAIRRARQKCGPALIDCRMSYSTTELDVSTEPAADDHLDSVSAMETYMANQGLWSSRWKQGLERSFARQLETAVNSIEHDVGKLDRSLAG